MADTKQEQDADDIVSRFPDPERDSRLRVPQEGDLPPIPVRGSLRPQPTVEPETGFLQQTRTGVAANNLMQAGAASTIGLTLVISIAIGAGAGWAADKFILHGTTPWGLIVGFLLGVAAGFFNLIRVASRLNS